MSLLSVVLLGLCVLVLVDCQFPQSPFLKGGKRRSHQRQTERNNNRARWPGENSDHIDGHSDNHDHGGTNGHKHVLGIKLPRGNGRGVGGLCGGQQYAGRTHICCGGIVKRRQGMRPACCGTSVFDFVFDICCSGEIRKRTVNRPQC